MIPKSVFHGEDRSLGIHKADFHVVRRKASEWYTAPPILTYIPVPANFTALYPHKVRCIGLRPTAVQHDARQRICIRRTLRSDRSTLSTRPYAHVRGITGWVPAASKRDETLARAQVLLRGSFSDSN